MTDTTQIPPPDPGRPWWAPDTRTAIVMWMMASTFLMMVLVWWKPPAADNQLLNTLIGIYGAGAFTTAITWWMGSSKGSEDKTAMLQPKASSP